MKSELVNQYSLFITSIFDSCKYRRTRFCLGEYCKQHTGKQNYVVYPVLSTSTVRYNCTEHPLGFSVLTVLLLYTEILVCVNHYCTEHPLGFCILTVLLLYTEILVCVNQIFVYNTIELFYGEFANQKKGTWFIKLMKKYFI